MRKEIKLLSFTMFKKAGKGRMKPFCVNETCSKFLPEDQRGYYKKKTAEAEPDAAAAEEKKPAKKATSKKAAAKKTGEKKTTTKKTTTRKTKKEAAE